jgi:hypothetical protein
MIAERIGGWARSTEEAPSRWMYRWSAQCFVRGKCQEMGRDGHGVPIPYFGVAGQKAKL